MYDGADWVVVGYLDVTNNRWLSIDGTVSLPGIGFGNDPDNGLCRIGANNWAMAAAGAKVAEVSAAGEWTYPLQPAFLVQDITATVNATGDGTVWTAAWPTEVYDQNGDFGSNTFTAPVTGRYHFDVCVYLEGIGASHSSVIISLVASNRTIRLAQCSPAAIKTATGTATLSGSIDVDMDAADTATVTVTVSGSTKTVTVGGASSFSGRLVC